MKKRHIIILCLVISLCVAADIYCAFRQEQRGAEYNISFIEGLNLFALSPIMWICVGVLMGSLIGMGKGLPAIIRLSLNMLAFAIIMMYVCTASLHVLGMNIGWVHTITAWCTLHPSIFTIPGFLCGLSGKKIK